MKITIQTLRAEGVFEVGRVPGTSFVYVVTEERTCFFHAVELPPRRLDTYGAYLAIHWIEQDSPSYQVAKDLGVTEVELRRAILEAGYARPPEQLAKLAGARAKRKFSNRRGKLLQISSKTRSAEGQ